MSASRAESDLGSCPSHDELTAFNAGRLPDADMQRVSEHLEASCARCDASLRELEDPLDPVLADLRAPSPLSSAEVAEACRRVLGGIPIPGYSLESTITYLPEAVGYGRHGTSTCITGFPDFDKYKQIQFIKRGGMGDVYKARHIDLDIIVALKVIRADKLANLSEAQRREWIERFRVEAKLVAKLDHPHIVRARDFGEHDGVPFFVMDYIEGGSLEPLLGKVDPHEAARLMEAVARGVAHAQKHGLIHRDIKPGNILLDPNKKQPRVADLGLAMPVTGDVRLTGYTRGYGAPEQVRRKEPLTFAADVYSLGATLYALLTGMPPEVGRRAELRALNPLVDVDLQAICVKCLDENPERRYLSAEELAIDLKRWLDDKEPTALKWSRPYRLGRWCKRNPGWVAVGLVAGLCLAIFDIGNAFALLRERENQVINSNAQTAQSVAKTVENHLHLLSSAVVREAKDAKLVELMKAKDYPALQKRIESINKFYADPDNGFTRVGAEKPFANWFVLDEKGKVLAHSFAEAVVGQVFDWRDYFQGAINKKDGQAYVSRIYQSKFADEIYKFAITAPIRDGETTLGTMTVNVPTGTAEETLLPKNAAQKAVLVGLWDSNPPPEPGAKIRTDLHSRGQPLILLHPAFDQGDSPVEIQNNVLLNRQNNELAELRMDAHYQDPVGEIDSKYAGRWLAASAPIKHTEFVVIVQQNYSEAVQPFAVSGRPLILWSAVAIVLVASIGIVVWSVNKRNQ